MVASGRPGGKPVRKRTAAAQQRFLEQLAQNEEARQQRLTGLRKEASKQVKVEVLQCATTPTPAALFALDALMLTLSAVVACAQGEACDPQIVEEDPGREPESNLPEPQPQLPQAVGAALGGEAVAGGSRRPARATGEPARLGQEVRRPVRSQPCVWLSALLDRVRLIHACVLQADGRFPCAGRCLGAAEAVR